MGFPLSKKRPMIACAKKVVRRDLGLINLAKGDLAIGCLVVDGKSESRTFYKLIPFSKTDDTTFVSYLFS